MHAMADKFWLKTWFTTIWLPFGPSTTWKMWCHFSLCSHCLGVCAGSCSKFLFLWHAIHFQDSQAKPACFFLYMACMPLWHAIHFQDSHAKPACFFPFTWHVCDCDMPFIFKITMPNLHVFFFTWHACMFITWKVFFAKPVGYNFSVAILLPCTEHMGIPNIHESHEHIFHAWFLLTGLAQAPSSCMCTGSLGSHWFAATYFYLSWAHQAPMSLQKHTCSNGGNLKISALVITHLEPTYNVMLLGVQVDPGYGAGG